MGQALSQRGPSGCVPPLPNPNINLKKTYFVDKMSSNFCAINHSAKISTSNRQVTSTFKL